MIERQTMYCHACAKDFTVELEIELNGNHVFECPHCEHEHCRVVEDGVITGERWASRNGATFWAQTYSGTSALAVDSSSAVTCAAGCATTTSTFTLDAWNNTSTAVTGLS